MRGWKGASTRSQRGFDLVQIDLEGAGPGQHEAHEELAGDLHQLSTLPQSSASTCAMPTCMVTHASCMLPFLGLCNLAKECRQQGAKKTGLPAGKERVQCRNSSASKLWFYQFVTNNSQQTHDVHLTGEEPMSVLGHQALDKCTHTLACHDRQH